MAGIGLAIQNKSREVASIESTSGINADVVNSLIIDMNVRNSIESNVCLDLRHTVVSDNTTPLDETSNQVVLHITASNIENVNPNENAEISTSQSEGFETLHFWPCKTPSSTTKGNKKAKGKVPAVATSEAWRQLQIQKLAEKKKARTGKRRKKSNENYKEEN